MKYLIPFLLVMLSMNVGVGQTISANINLSEDRFEIQSIDPGGSQSLIISLEARYEVDEIIISCRLPKTDENQFYRLGLEAGLDGNPLRINPFYLTGAVGERITVSDRTVKQEIIWSNLIKEYFNLEGKLLLQLNVLLERDYECPPTPPEFFTWKDQKPHALIGAVGIGSILAGQIFRIKRDNQYDDYLVQESLADAQPIYDAANDNHRTHLVLSWAGSAILIGNLFWDYLRFSRYKRNEKDFERYCQGQNDLTIQPIINSTGNSITGVGIQLKYEF